MANLAIPSAVVGQIAIFAVLAILALTFLREVGRWVAKGVLVLGVVVALAVWIGWLDETAAGRIFGWLGDQLLAGIAIFGRWLAAAWHRLTGGGAGD